MIPFEFVTLSDEVELELRQIEPGDRFTGFSLGDQAYTALKTFLQKRAKNFHAQNLAKTYAIFSISKDSSDIVAYVTLVCGEVVLEDGDDALLHDVEYKYLHYPAVKIARLAVHKDWRGQGLGEKLVHPALGITKDKICPAVGCRFIMVDSKVNAVKFYTRCGFSLLDTSANIARDEPVMFIDLYKT